MARELLLSRTMLSPTKIKRALPASVLVAVLLTVFLVWRPFSPSEDWVSVEIPLRSSEKGFSILTGSRGPALRDRITSTTTVSAGEQTLRHRIPSGTYSQLRVVPVDRVARVEMGRARIVSPEGDLLWEAPPDAWGLEQTQQPAPTPEAEAETIAQRYVLSFGKGMAFQSGREPSAVLYGSIALVFSLLIALAAAMLEGPLAKAWARILGLSGAAVRWAERSPGRGLAIIAAGAVMLACFPVVFLGKSFVSPSTGGHGIYGKSPPIPGIDSAQTEDFKGSDVLVIQVGHRPYSMLAHEALWEHGEFPLWNRYNSCGSPFIGQGLSMMGDPLHWLTIAANGAAWAWDAKFLIARWLFAFGIGLCVWTVTRRFLPAAGAAAGAAFLGFFAYRFNHPANFGVCYAPWILLCWQRIAAGKTKRELASWALGLALACTAVFHSGTAKEASMLVVFVNTCGVLLILCGRGSAWRTRFAFGCAGTLVFALVNAPFWLTFLDALGKSFTVSAKPPVFQIAPGNLIGLFDDLFYQRTTFGEWFTDPSANVLVLAGVLIGLVRWREMWGIPLVRALVLASAIPFAFAFGIIPPPIVQKIPFIANISHIGNTFSCILLLHAAVFAGLAWSAKPVRREWPIFLAALAALVALYWLWPVPVPAMPQAIAKALDYGTGSRFFWAVAPLLILAVGVLPGVVSAARKGGAFLPRLALLCIAGVALFRHAQWTETTFDFYVVNPQPRPDFSVPSPAVERLRPLLTEPSRVHGIDFAFISGYSASLRIEHLASADALISPAERELIAASGIEFQWKWRSLLPPEKMESTQKWTDLFNNRYFLSHAGVTPPPGYRHLYSEDLEAWESPTAWPRAFFTDSTRSYETIGDFAKLVNASSGPFIALQSGEPTAGTGIVVPAKTYAFRPNSTRFEIDAPTPGFVALTETWYDGDIRATLNGQPAEALRVNHAFRGVRIPAAGKYIVEFAYWPRVLTKALWLCAAGIAGALGLAAVGLRAGSGRQDASI